MCNRKEIVIRVDLKRRENRNRWKEEERISGRKMLCNGGVHSSARLILVHVRVCYVSNLRPDQH